MRVAFVSCFSTRLFPKQPVWDWIRAKAPDHLVLLGDAVYLDVPAAPTHPRDMGELEFAQHKFSLYAELLAHAGFAALVRSMPAGRVWSIWDDHDFLWNDSLGAEVAADPTQRDKIRLTTAFQEAFRRALASGLAPGSFPGSHTDPAFWDLQQPRLTTPSIALGEETRLHLADDRTWRTRTWLLSQAKRTVLGADQRAQFEADFAAHPDAVHLFASGSTMADYKKGYATDWQWLLAQARTQRTLVLSGDIHRNESDAFFTGGFPLHEATSSGAAVKDAVVLGKAQRNYGLLDIDAQAVQFALYADNALQTKWSRNLKRDTWLPA